MAEQWRVGLLGGSFDPPHKGHLSLAEAALASGQVDRILFMPAAVPPHKQGNSASPEYRLAMTSLLIQGKEETMAVSSEELEMPTPNWTVRTVRMLIKKHPTWKWRLVMGSDMALDFGRWREARALLNLAMPLWAERPGALWPQNEATLGELPGLRPLSPEERKRLILGRMGMVPESVSSGQIRRSLAKSFAEGKDIPQDVKEWLTPEVIDYIVEHKLYRSPS